MATLAGLKLLAQLAAEMQERAEQSHALARAHGLRVGERGTLLTPLFCGAIGPAQNGLRPSVVFLGPP